MNSAEPLSAEILAALLWDAPALRGGSRGAQAFADAFGPPPWNEPPLDAGLLAAAAHAVQLHRGGESTDALAIMRTLIEQPDGMLLSLCLTGWAAPPEGLRWTPTTVPFTSVVYTRASRWPPVVRHWHGVLRSTHSARESECRSLPSSQSAGAMTR